MSVTTARQKVLIYLTKNRAVSAAQIGRALKMSAANVRHHLSVLCSDGRVSIVGQTKQDGRGRPVKLYGLSQKLMGDNLALLSDVLLDEFIGGMPPSKRDAALKSVARRIAESSRLINENVPIAKRLTLVVEKLNEMKYQARWEAGAEGPRVIFAACPYAAVIEKHPELCKMDASILATYLNSETRQTAKIEKGMGVCIFAIR